MTFILNSQNVVKYLAEQGLLKQDEKSVIKVESVAAKNFNLLLTFADGNKLLVKQERHNHEGKASGEIFK